MRLAYTVLLLVSLAMAGCAKKSHVHARQPFEDFELCSDVRFRSLCVPAFERALERDLPVRVDTNLKTPSPGRATAAG